MSKNQTLTLLLIVGALAGGGLLAWSRMDRSGETPPTPEATTRGVESPQADPSRSGDGGQATGGQATGGQATGGQATGGQATGGQATGGQATGGQATGVSTPTTTPAVEAPSLAGRLSAALELIEPGQRARAIGLLLPQLAMGMDAETSQRMVDALEDDQEHWLCKIVLGNPAIYADPGVRAWFRATDDSDLYNQHVRAEARVADRDAVEYLHRTQITHPADRYRSILRLVSAAPVLIRNSTPAIDEAILDMLVDLSRAVAEEAPIDLWAELEPRLQGIPAERLARYRQRLGQR